MAAVLTIQADGAAVRRLFAEMRAESRRVAGEMSSAFRRAGADIVRAARESGRDAARAYTDAARVKQHAAEAGARAERQATAVTRAESAARTTATNREADAAKRSAEDIARARETAERRATRAAEREANRRASLDRQRAREEAQTRRSDERFGGRVARVAGVAYQTSAAIYGDIRGAQQTRAQALSTLYDTFRQTGATASEGRGYARQLTAAAAQMGVPTEVLAQAAARAQSEFSSLAGDNPQDRQRAFTRFLSRAQLGRTYAGAGSIGEFTRVAGLIDQIGGPEQARSATLMSMARLAELGSIELSQVSREGMTPLMARVGQAQGALGSGATDAQRSAAGQRALIQGMAEMEVLRGTAGYNPRAAGNVMANLGSALSSNVVQDRMRNNIMHAAGVSRADRTDIEAALFENDPNQRGRRRLRADLANDPLAFITAAGGAFQNNQTAFRNLFAGGGQGNPQGLQANWRNMAASLFTVGERGETGYQRVERFRRAAQGAGDANDMQRRAGITEADPMTEFVRNEETRLTALTENTGALGRLTAAIAGFAASNPLLASVGGTAGGALAGGLLPRAASAAPAVARAAAALGGGGAVGAGITGAAALAGGAIGLGAGDLLNRGGNALAGSSLGNSMGFRSDQQRGFSSTVSIFNRDTWRELGSAIAEAFGANPPVVRVDPAAAAQLARQAGASSGERPPESGR